MVFAAIARATGADLLTVPGFRRFLATRWSAQLATGLFHIGAAAFLLLSLDPSKASSAWDLFRIAAITGLPYALSGPFVSQLADRWERHRLLVVANILRTVLLVLGAAMVFLVPWGRAGFLLSVVAILTLGRLFLATMEAALPRVVGTDELVPANSIATVGGSVAGLAGAGIGGWFSSAAAHGPLIVMAAAGLCLLTSAYLAHQMGEDGLGPELDAPRDPLTTEMRKGLAQVRDGIRAVAGTRRAWGPLLTMSLTRLFTAVATVATFVAVRQVVHTGSSGIGLILAASGGGALLGAAGVTIARRQIGIDAATVIPWALAGSGVLSVVVIPGITMTILMVGSASMGISLAVASIATRSLVQSAVADDLRGRVFTAYDAGATVMSVVGIGLGATMLAPTLVREVVLGSGGALLLVAAGSALWLRDLPGAEPG